MFSLSKKSHLLLIMLLTITHINYPETYKMKNGTVTFEFEENSSKNYTLWDTAKLIAPYAIPPILTYIMQKYNENPEEAAIDRELKKIELETKKHPDYPAISLQLKKNKAEELAIKNQEQQLKMSIEQAQLIQHHQEQIITFKRCDNPFQQDFCDYMSNIHQQMLERMIQKNSTQS